MGAAIVRLLGRLCLGISIMLLGLELLRLVETGLYDPLSSMEVWAILYQEGLAATEKAMKEGMFPGIWDGLIAPLLNIPAIYSTAVIGGIVLFLGKKTS